MGGELLFVEKFKVENRRMSNILSGCIWSNVTSVTGVDGQECLRMLYEADITGEEIVIGV